MKSFPKAPAAATDPSLTPAETSTAHRQAASTPGAMPEPPKSFRHLTATDPDAERFLTAHFDCLLDD
jgi:hypothetical protein